MKVKPPRTPDPKNVARIDHDVTLRPMREDVQLMLLSPDGKGSLEVLTIRAQNRVSAAPTDSQADLSDDSAARGTAETPPRKRSRPTPLASLFAPPEDTTPAAGRDIASLEKWNATMKKEIDELRAEFAKRHEELEAQYAPIRRFLALIEACPEISDVLYREGNRRQEQHMPGSHGYLELAAELGHSVACVIAGTNDFLVHAARTLNNAHAAYELGRRAERRAQETSILSDRSEAFHEALDWYSHGAHLNHPLALIAKLGLEKKQRMRMLVAEETGLEARRTSHLYLRAEEPVTTATCTSTTATATATATEN